MASRSKVLYVGVTGNFENRVIAHKLKAHPKSFTAKYNVTKLVYCEEYFDAKQAIARETQIKTWRRDKKVALIESMNPEWIDLADDAAVRGQRK